MKLTSRIVAVIIAPVVVVCSFAFAKALEGV